MHGEAAERVGKLDRFSPEPDANAVPVGVDVIRCQSQQPGDRLREQQHERAGDAIARIEVLVAEQSPQDGQAAISIVGPGGGRLVSDRRVECWCELAARGPREERPDP